MITFAKPRECIPGLPAQLKNNYCICVDIEIAKIYIKFRGVKIRNNLPNFLKNTPYHKFRYLYERHILESYQQS